MSEHDCPAVLPGAWDPGCAAVLRRRVEVGGLADADAAPHECFLRRPMFIRSDRTRPVHGHRSGGSSARYNADRQQQSRHHRMQNRSQHRSRRCLALNDVAAPCGQSCLCPPYKVSGETSGARSPPAGHHEPPGRSSCAGRCGRRRPPDRPAAAACRHRNRRAVPLDAAPGRRSRPCAKEHLGCG